LRMIRPGGEPCRRCGHLLEYRDMVRVTRIGTKRPVWVCQDCRNRWRQIGKVR